jgi:hypothetical protein
MPYGSNIEFKYDIFLGISSNKVDIPIIFPSFFKYLIKFIFLWFGINSDVNNVSSKSKTIFFFSILISLVRECIRG